MTLRLTKINPDVLKEQLTVLKSQIDKFMEEYIENIGSKVIPEFSFIDGVVLCEISNQIQRDGGVSRRKLKKFLLENGFYEDEKYLDGYTKSGEESDVDKFRSLWGLENI